MKMSTMMTKTWLISDTHFGHENSWAKFKLEDGCTPLRPFTSTEQMDREMVQRWNSVVGPGDRVYHLGDVVIARKNLSILYALNGRKKLIRGNHDIFKLEDYTPFFDDILGSHKLGEEGFLLTHIPVHPESLARWSGGNIHGHLHANYVKEPKWGKRDPRYLCVSVEQTNFTPISLEEASRRISDQRKAAGSAFYG